MSVKNPFSAFGRMARPLPKGAGKLFTLVPAGNAHIPALRDQYPTDEDGVARVYTTLASAVAAVVSGRGDVIQVMPGSYTISTVVSSSASNWSLVGVGTPCAATFTGSGASILTLTGDSVEVSNIGFAIATTKKAITLTGADDCVIRDCVFTSAVGGTASHFIHMLTTACNYNIIKNNRFITNLDVSGAGVTQTSHITGLGIGNVIEGNVFVAGRLTTANAGAVTSGIVFAAAADAGNTVRKNTFTEFNGATFTAGVDYGTTAVGGSVICVENNFMLATAANAVVNGSNAGSFANNIASGTV